MRNKNMQTIELNVSKELKSELEEVTKGLGFTQSEVLRFLIEDSIRRVKADAKKAGGFDKLEFTLEKNI